MFVDPEFKPSEPIYKIEDGFFFSAWPHNFGHTLLEHPTLYQDYEHFLMRGLKGYGVCDNIQQIKDYYTPHLDTNKRYCVGITSVKKSEQPERDGWRWHKWGAYIGDKNPQYEYLYDEPNIDEVLCYDIVLLDDKDVEVSGEEVLKAFFKSILNRDTMFS